MLKLKSLQAQEKLVAKQLKSVPTVYPDYKIQQKKSNFLLITACYIT